MGKKSTKTTSTSTPWQPAQPILLGAGQDIQNIVKGNQGNLAGLESGLTGSLIPGLTAKVNDTSMLQPGQNYIGSTLKTNPGNANPANSFLKNTLGGQYLNSNPYTEQMAQFAGQQAGNAINSAFSSAGRTGSGNNVTDTARGVDQAANQVLFQNYQNERGLQNQAAGELGQNYNAGLSAQSAAASMLPSYQSSQFAGYQPLLGATQLAGQLPYFGANAEGNIGGLFNGYGTQTGTQPGGWGTALGGILGAGLGGWASGGFALPAGGIF